VGSIEGPGGRTQYLPSIGQKLGAGGGQFDVAAVADEELGAKLAFEVLICCESDGPARCRRSAARPKCSSSATATK
jgi:hypothetical protein